ncbi:hypothetical protein Ae406Ps2_3020 [Pseudonocardia sp. Ae406_Ps2]|nr:hypothetical protein Ae331Ps2_2908c [Pseudonocardia sp. Ae331_Ps2]OLM03020.1 hypothetical protein Ae406Ps2_3020 [Pseudonocardia sp. Ae406_Ps2]OLM12127.1 hypothetical protein Ae505Ps2_2254c [Pseudonocardia sp. Ae505_Ps2]
MRAPLGLTVLVSVGTPAQRAPGPDVNPHPHHSPRSEARPWAMTWRWHAGREHTDPIPERTDRLHPTQRTFPVLSSVWTPRR